MSPSSQANTFILVDVAQITNIISNAVADSLAAQSAFNNDPDNAKADAQLLSYQETCDMLSVTRSGLFKWIKKGFITPRYIGDNSKPFFLKSDILEALKAKGKPELPV